LDRKEAVNRAFKKKGEYQSTLPVFFLSGRYFYVYS